MAFTIDVERTVAAVALMVALFFGVLWSVEKRANAVTLEVAVASQRTAGVCVNSLWRADTAMVGAVRRLDGQEGER